MPRESKTVESESGCTELWDDPYLSAFRNRIKDHYNWRAVGNIQNSCDGSGSWIAIHLFDADGKFVQGGWLPQDS